MANETLAKLIQNNSKLLNIIRCYNSVDRNLLCELMQLSWPTLQKTVQLLKDAGILINKASTSVDGIDKTSDPKKEKEEYIINPTSGYYVGISIGGSQIKLCIIDMNYKIASKENFYKIFIDKFGLFSDSDFIRSQKPEYGYLYVSTPTDFFILQERLNYILDQMIKLDLELGKRGQTMLGIGFAFTGAVNNKKKEIIKSFSLDCFNNLPIKYDSLIYPEKLAYFLSKNINITFDNIAKAALVSEKFSLYDNLNPNSIYKNRKNIGCIYLGSGIGDAFILDNTLYRGTSNFSELGHIDVIDPDELLNKINNKNIENDYCTCGGHNCLEHKIRKNVFNMDINEFKSYTAGDLKKNFYQLDNPDIRLEILAFYINQAIKIATNLLNLDLIILTGKLTQFKEDLEKYLYNEKSKNTIGYINSDCSLVTSTYGALAPSAGAAILSALPENNESVIWY
ncbi:MAG: ROK family protein [Faecalicatena sp.]|uniref:ROK family protein n=1 Tax=Faecalicatena sp. TaxID=2005360 RepID=UPI00258A73C1|nr:ROK family protein [Faecalicatena sp.]MCI6465346.1 ROK family protein [Faecalicatena sp.]MDY5617492.1 ROK family protein [Lachnospiraceae bacterium]